MFARSRRSAMVAGLVLLGALAGCGPLANWANVFNPDLMSALGMGTEVATLPGDAPGLLVTVENRTTRWILIVVEYRDANDEVSGFRTNVAPADKTSQMLVCPIKEITMGSVASLEQVGARVYLVDPASVGGDTTALDNAPFVEVDPFGVLLQDGINYDCGDGITFTVQESSQSRSGYQAFAYIRRAGG